jgi:hypothetical protein
VVEVAVARGGWRGPERDEHRVLGHDPVLPELLRGRGRLDAPLQHRGEQLGPEPQLLLALGADPLHLERGDVGGVVEQGEVRRSLGLVDGHERGRALGRNPKRERPDTFALDPHHRRERPVAAAQLRDEALHQAARRLRLGGDDRQRRGGVEEQQGAVELAAQLAQHVRAGASVGDRAADCLVELHRLHEPLVLLVRVGVRHRARDRDERNVARNGQHGEGQRVGALEELRGERRRVHVVPHGEPAEPGRVELAEERHLRLGLRREVEPVRHQEVAGP